MKYAFAIFLGLISLTAQAGTPDQDPVVKLLRERFKTARVPSLDEMRLGETWVCQEFSAIHDSYQKSFVDSFKFQALEDLAINSQATFNYQQFALQSEGWVSTFKEGAWAGRAFMYVRMTALGSLIYEVVVSEDGSKKENAEAISRAGFKAQFYGVCPQTHVKK